MRRVTWVVVLLAIAPSCATRIVPDQASAAKPRERDPANFYFDVAVGGGTYKHETSGDGGLASGDTDGGFAALRFEGISNSGIGGGIALEGTGSDDDLMIDAGTPNVDGSTGDVFAYFVGDPINSDRFRLPLRVGPYFHRLELNDDTTPGTIDWDGVGLRLEAGPEVWLLRRNAFSLGLTGSVSIGAHVTSIDAEVAGLSDTFDGDGLTFGAGLGIAALFANHVTTQLGYVYRMTRESESDPSNGVFVREATQSFSGVVLQIGGRF